MSLTFSIIHMALLFLNEKKKRKINFYHCFIKYIQTKRNQRDTEKEFPIDIYTSWVSLFTISKLKIRFSRARRTH